jgi:hypothetical protein
MTSKEFMQYLRDELIEGDAALEQMVRPDEWVFKSGVPDNCPQVESVLFRRVEAAIETWKEGTPARRLDTDGWSTQEWKQFIQSLPDTMTVAQMSDLDSAFDFTHRTNGEILQVWFPRAIANRYDPAYPAIEKFLVTIGRIWLIGGVYRSLAATPEGLEMAKAIYAKARPGYHPVTVSVIDRILQWEG